MRFCLLLLLACCGCWAAEPHSQARPARPRMGLALAGGSALGLAHAGVLQWFDENQIPVDYVAGTSMGGLIGALYATGHSGAEIRDFVRAIDWSSALAVSTPFESLAFRRKEDQRAIPSSAEVGLRGGLSLPGGLSSGHGVGLVLSRFAAPYSDLASFDELPIPFRSVATDIVSAREVVFDRGSLFEALRATMSLPAVFTPVHRGAEVLVDGGLVNNLPVGLVQRMGAQRVVAVTLDVPPDVSKYESLLGVARRSLSVMVTANERRNAALADLVVAPELKGFNGADYGRWEEIIARGYAAAEARRAELLRYRLGDAEWETHLAARKAKRREEQLRPEYVAFEGRIGALGKEAFSLAVLPPEGAVVDGARLETELTALTGTGRYGAAHYERTIGSGRQGLLVRLHEKPGSPPFFKPLVELDGISKEPLRFGMGGRLVFLDFGGANSEWRTELSGGIFNRIISEYYWRVQGERIFLAPQFHYQNTGAPVFSGKARVADLTNHRVAGALDLGFAIDARQEVRAGFEVGRREQRLDTGVTSLPLLNGRTAAFTARYVYDGQDSGGVARRGLYSTLRTAWVADTPGTERGFPLFEGTLHHVKPLRQPYFLSLRLFGGSAFRHETPHDLFTLGGPGRLSALVPAQLAGNRYYLVRASLLRQLNSKSLGVFGRFYLQTGYEVGNAWSERRAPTPRHDGVLGLVGETALGVVFFGGAVGDRGDHKLFLRFGRLF